MTYFGFLVLFVLAPIGVLGVLTLRDLRHRRPFGPSLRGIPPWPLIAALMLIALVWTTPWDNYLIARGVWAYHPALVSGVVLGWVPLEEYLFFLLQPIMTGLWFVYLARRMRPSGAVPEAALKIRVGSVAAGLLLMTVCWLPLLMGYRPATYLCLILVWALPPILIQLAFGADLLWQHRGLAATTITTATAWLAAADALAIGAGTWRIDPAQSFVNLKLGGLLPIEEAVFFLITNVLVVFGLLLGMATMGLERLPESLARRRPARE